MKGPTLAYHPSKRVNHTLVIFSAGRQCEGIMSEEKKRKKHLEDIDKLLADKLAPAKKNVPEEEKSTREEILERKEAAREEPSAEEKPCDACGETFKRNVQNTSIMGYPVCPHCGNNPDQWDSPYTLKPGTHRSNQRTVFAMLIIFLVIILLGLLG